MSTRISVEKTALERTPSFSINKVGEDSGVVFAGLPLGHEFTSLVLALLQVSGRTPKVEDAVGFFLYLCIKSGFIMVLVAKKCYNHIVKYKRGYPFSKISRRGSLLRV